MSFILPYTGNAVASKQRREPITVNEQQQNGEDERLFEQHKKELEDIIERQEERIKSLRTALAIEVECDERARRSRLLGEKQDLNSELTLLSNKLHTLDMSWREARQASDHEFKWGEMKSKLSQTLSHTTDLQDEIKECEKQIVDIEDLMNNRLERISTVRRELQQAQQQVKWLLECQVIDDQSFTNRIKEEEENLRQLIEARNEMEKEVSQLNEKEGLEVLPLKEDVDILEQYLEEMQNRTHELQLQYQDFKYQVEEAKKIEADLSGNTALPHIYKRSVEYVDQQLIRSLNEQLETARRLNHSPISVNSNKEQWLQNYFVVWSSICHHCTGLLQDAKLAFANDLTKVKESIKISQQKIHDIIGFQNGEGKEREIAFLNLENLLHLMCEEEKVKKELFYRIEENAKNIGEEPTLYLSLVNTEGYDDIIDEDQEEIILPNEANEHEFEPIPEENPEVVISEIRSMAEISSENMKENVLMQETTYRYRNYLQKFLQQKSLLKSEQINRMHVPLRRTVVSNNPPKTVEESLSQIQQKLIDEVVNFVKNQKTNTIWGQKNTIRENYTLADPNYAFEVHEMQEKIQRLLSKRQSTFLLGVDHGDNSMRVTSEIEVFRRINIEGARLPPNIVNASSTLQAKYFLSCALRGFTAVIITSNMKIPTVRQIFLTRDLEWLCLRDVSKPEGTNSEHVDTAVKLIDVYDILLLSNEQLTLRKLKPELSFAIMLKKGKEREDYWVIQTDNSESRKFWAYVLAWIINETAPENKDAVITSLKKAKKIFVLDAARTTADTVEPTERHKLFVQVDEK
ncbi:uncharacterized protein TM35_000081550 [Trypanosoma theileri]|uniref:Uncharacterized protein n=1 Tax=Trypanosoma theileri TaxID=67003 RepID=A0A1X0P092_9TRYP|nr:uncharacterized protein TM35_000081550 [Trypanosoma theileri]ORC90357.1 hypothetical protein TM35_000081550 [Trypanosoma theileri]